MDFVYIIDRSGELDVYESHADATTAAEILGAEIIEQPVFRESGTYNGKPCATGQWLELLRKEGARG